MAQVGILTRYYSHESAYLAVRLADWFALRGDEVSFLAYDPQPASLGVPWDSKVCFAGPRLFTAWAEKMNLLVWTHTPSAEQLSWAARHKIRTAIVPLWHELRSDHRKAFRKASFVVSPSKATQNLLKLRWKLKNGIAAPWCAGLPITTKTQLRDEDRLKLAISLLDLPYPDDVEQMVKVISEVLSGTVRLDLSVLYIPSRCQPKCCRRLTRLAKKYGSRLTLLPRPAFSDHLRILQRHDFTVWPSYAESVGLLALTSLAAGTPVLTFKQAVLDEFLTLDNSVQIPTQVLYNKLGVPTSTPDYVHLGQMLLDMDGPPGRTIASQLQTSTHKGLQSRSQEFHSAWREVCDGL